MAARHSTREAQDGAHYDAIGNRVPSAVNLHPGMSRHRAFARWRALCLVLYVLAFSCLGLEVNVIGPTLEALAERVGHPVYDLGVVLSASGLLSTLGAVPAGWGIDKFDGHWVLAFSLVVQAAALAVVPRCTSLVALTCVYGCAAATFNFINTGGNTLVAWVAPENAGPWLNLVDAGFGVGSFFAPVVAHHMGALAGGTAVFYVIATSAALTGAALLLTPSPPRLDAGDCITPAPSTQALLRGSLSDSLSAQLLQPGGSADRLESGTSADRLESSAAADRLESGAAADRLESGAAADRLESGGGADRLAVGELDAGASMLPEIAEDELDTADGSQSKSSGNRDIPPIKRQLSGAVKRVVEDFEERFKGEMQPEAAAHDTWHAQAHAAPPSTSARQEVQPLDSQASYVHQGGNDGATSESAIAERGTHPHAAAGGADDGGDHGGLGCSPGLLVAVAVFVGANVGGSVNFGAWLFTYARKVAALSSPAAAQLNALYWAVFTAGRLGAVFIAACTGPMPILVMSTAVACSGMLPPLVALWLDGNTPQAPLTMPRMMLWPEVEGMLQAQPGSLAASAGAMDPTVALTLAACLYGVGAAPGFANAFSLLASEGGASGRANAVLAAAAGVGSMTLPAATAYLAVATPLGPAALLVVTGGSLALSTASLAVAATQR